MDETRQTVSHTVRVEGIGLHSGARCAVEIAPARSGNGVIINGSRLALSCVESGFLATRVAGRGGSVSTIEHLMSAVFALKIDDVAISVTGGEVPILDGTADGWFQRLEPTGARPMAPPQFLEVTETIRVQRGDAWIVAEPYPDCHLSVEVDYPSLGRHTFAGSLADWPLAAEARTFGFLSDHQRLKERGLALGANLENTLVFDGSGRVMGTTPLKYLNEIARHKWIDLVGDLSLLGMRLRAKITAFRNGHRLHHELVNELLARFAPLS